MATMLCRLIGMSDQPPWCSWGLAVQVMPTVSRSTWHYVWLCWSVQSAFNRVKGVILNFLNNSSSCTGPGIKSAKQVLDPRRGIFKIKGLINLPYIRGEIRMDPKKEVYLYPWRRYIFV
jgi:hypothetical protein